MTTVRALGFTIIELMLFLAVSGFLFVALLVGVNNGIVQQRYKDSVYAFSSFLQNQYFEVLNPRNEQRTSDLKCTNSVVSASDPSVPSGTTDPRGASKCVILGKAISVKNSPEGGDTKIKSYTVVGTCDVTPVDNKCENNNFQSDTEALARYQPKIIPETAVAPTEIGLEWGSWLAKKDPSNNLIDNGPIASYLILRSPLSGTIKAFASSVIDYITVDISSNIGASATSVSVCVLNQNKGLQPTYSVSLDTRIGGSSAVTVKGDGSGC